MSRVPSRIGRYDVESLVSQGVRGDVYLVRDPQRAARVTVRVINPIMHAQSALDACERDARALIAAPHPAIAALLDTGEHDGAPFIVSEYVIGQIAAELLTRRSPVPLSDRWRWCLSLCAGLAHAHARGVVHGAINLRQLSIDLDGQLKILDFGVGRLVNPAALPDEFSTAPNELEALRCLAPEQFQGRAPDAHTDQFAAAAVCFQLLYGQPAFSGRNGREVREGVSQRSPVRVNTVEIKDAVRLVLERALAKDPANRFPDMVSFATALADASGFASAGLRQPAADDRLAASAPAASETMTFSDATMIVRRPVLSNRQQEPPPPPPNKPVADPFAPAGVDDGATVVTRRPAMPSPTPSSGETMMIPPMRKAAQAEPSATEAPRWRTSSQAPRAEAASETRRAASSSSSTRKTPGKPLAAGVRLKIDPRTMTGVAIASVVAVIVMTVGGLAWWLWPAAGEMLTIQKPVGGTIVVSSKIRCGSDGNDCAASFPKGTAVELQLLPASGFAPGEYLGDCAPVGRINMDTARRCGATFVPMIASATTKTWTLTITPPTGGTILAGADIQCGPDGRGRCSAEIPDGAQVTLIAQPDPGFASVSFVGECGPAGTTVMNQARVCGAMFVKASAPLPPPTPVSVPVTPGRGGRGTGGVVLSPPDGGNRALTTTTVPMVAGPGGQPQAPPPPTPTTVVIDGTVAPPPITASEFARKTAIPTLIGNYCAALQTLKASEVKKYYPTKDTSDLNFQFRQYKSLVCTVKVAEIVFKKLEAEAGRADVEFDMKQEIVMRSGGAPKTTELHVEAALIRVTDRTDWQIHQLKTTEKPKP